MAQPKQGQLLLFCLLLAAGSAVRINEEGQKVIYVPKGESVNLGCPFSSDPEDNTPDNDWDIEWRQVKPGPHQQGNPLLGYHDHRVIHGGPADLQQRVGFMSPDPSQYDASMQLRDLQIADSATYECTVKKTTEATRKVTITVQERPLAPECYIIGDIAYGQDITLRCISSMGSPPLQYRWTMTHGKQFRDWIPGRGTVGSVPGDYHIYDLCDDDVGTYQCSVGNNVGIAYCSVEISFNGFNRGWIIGGSILISLLALALIIGGIIWCCWCCCWGKGCCGGCLGCYCGTDYCWDCCCSCCRGGQKQEQCGETKASEICVDADAPPSRPCSQAFSRVSSLHSLLGYQTRTPQYAQCRKYAPPIVQVKMTSPPDSDVSMVLTPEIPSPPSSEQGDAADPFYPVKGRDPYAPGDYTKGESRDISTPRPHIYSNPHQFSTVTSDPSCVRWKNGDTKAYKGAVTMMRSPSKDGLLI